MGNEFSVATHNWSSSHLETRAATWNHKIILYSSERKTKL